MRRHLFSWLLILSTSAYTAWTQNMVSASATPGDFSYTVSTNRFMGTPVTGAPYSATQVHESVQVLADGTRITQNRGVNSVTTYRDSQGRTRTERKMFRDDGPTMIEINDPVAGVGYALDAGAKVAHKFALRQPPQLPKRIETMGTIGGGGGSSLTISASAPPPTTAVAQPAVRPADDPGASARPRHQTESLGADTMEGVLVKGTRTTTTYPVGSVGNDREFSSYNETWFSPDLRLTVRSKNVDPRSGESTTHLTNLSRDEPDASLFQPPADYSVVEEPGPTFTIHSERQQ